MPRSTNTPSLVYQVKRRLEEQARFGESKHQAKQRAKREAEQRGEKWNPSQVEGIYSFETMRTYMRQGAHFVKWVRERHPEVKWLEDARRYIPEYLSQYQSAWTVRTKANALAKIYGCKSTELGVQLPKRDLHAIKRSRRPAKRDVSFSETRNKDLVDFCRGTGLRRKELQALRPEDVYQAANGRVFVHVRSGKGGRTREVPVLLKYQDRVWEIAQRAKANNLPRVFPTVPLGADIHSYRREYAQATYMETVERLPSNVTKEYYNTKDGLHFERHAMKFVTKALGHNRLEVAARNYLR